MGYLETPRVRFRVGLYGTSNVSDLRLLAREHTQFQEDGEWREPHDGFRGNARAPFAH